MSGSGGLVAIELALDGRIFLRSIGVSLANFIVGVGRIQEVERVLTVTHVLVGHDVVGQHHLQMIQHLLRTLQFVKVALSSFHALTCILVRPEISVVLVDQVLGHLRVHRDDGERQTHIVLRIVNPRVVDTAPCILVRGVRFQRIGVLHHIGTGVVVELLHDVVIQDVAVGGAVLLHRHQTVGEALILQILIEAETSERRRSEIERAVPVAVGHHLQHHQIAAGQIVSIASFLFVGLIREDDTVYNIGRVGTRHSTRFKDMLTVNVDIETVAKLRHDDLTDIMAGTFHLPQEVFQCHRFGFIAADDHHIAATITVLFPCEVDGQRIRFVGFALHLIDIPAGREQRQVAVAHIRTVAFHLLSIPDGEGVVVAHREQDGIRRT